MRRDRLPLLALLAACLLAPAARAQDEPGGSPPAPNEEPSASDTLFEQSDLGNVVQAAQMHYHAGRRELQGAERLERRAAEAPSEDKRQDLIAKRAAALERAAQEFTEAIGYERTLLAAYGGLGTAYRGLGKIAEALQVHAAALRIDPGDAENFQGWAESLLALDLLGDATHAYDTLAASRPEQAAVLLATMKRWLADKQRDPGGLRPEDIERLAQWIAEHEGA